MEDEVKDTILTSKIEDVILVSLIEIAKISIQDNRPLSDHILNEPIFWRRYFIKWVHEGFEELGLIEALEQGSAKE